MIPMRLADVAVAVQAVRVPQHARDSIQRVTTDSRDVRPGDLFLAIRGQRHDGHDFAHEAIQRGALASVVARNWIERTGLSDSLPCLVVDDTVEALRRLAAHYRRHIMPPGTIVVAVTGSNGKTTTKCMIDHVLRPSLPGRASPRSFNNRIGVPLTLLSAQPDDRYLIVEVGSNAPGEVDELASLASPNAAVVTSIGCAHTAGLGGIDQIAAEKSTVFRHVRPGGIGVVNVDRHEIRPHLPARDSLRLIEIGLDQRADRRIVLLQSALSGTVFVLEDRYRVEVPLPGAHHATNAAAAFCMARWLGLDPNDIIERLASFVPPEGRTRSLNVGDLKVIDDAYNANPASMTAAVRALKRTTSSRRVFVMGDMLELGRKGPVMHRDVAREVVAAGIEVLVAVGPASSDAARSLQPDANGRTRVVPCADAQGASRALDELLAPGDIVWVKGSRAMELDRVVDHLKHREPSPAGSLSGVRCSPRC